MSERLVKDPRTKTRTPAVGLRSIEKSSGRTGLGPDKFEKFRTKPDQDNNNFGGLIVFFLSSCRTDVYFYFSEILAGIF